MTNLASLEALDVNHGMISANHPAITRVVGIRIAWIITIWCLQYSLTNIQQTRRTPRRTLCFKIAPESITFRIDAKLAGHEEFYVCCLSGASDAYLDDGEDIFSISAASK